MKELTRMDYMYIIIIIILLASLIWVVLPFVYTSFNGNIDSSDCITNMDSVQCNQVSEILKVCDYKCINKYGSVENRSYRWVIK